MDANGEAPAGVVDWGAVKAMYLARDIKVKDIAALHGIAEPRIHERARLEDWPRRAAAGIATPANRLRSLIRRRLDDLEAAARADGVAPAEDTARGVRAMSLLVATLDKLLELERKTRAAKTKRRGAVHAVDDARRRELARRLDALCREPIAPGDVRTAEIP